MAEKRPKGELFNFPVTPHKPPTPPSPFLETVGRQCTGLPETWQLIMRALSEEVRLLKENESTHQKMHRCAKLEAYCDLLKQLRPRMTEDQRKQISALLEYLLTITHNRGAIHIVRSARLAIY